MPGAGNVFATAGAASLSLAGGGEFLAAADRAEPLAIAVRDGMSSVAVGGETLLVAGGGERLAVAVRGGTSSVTIGGATLLGPLAANVWRSLFMVECRRSPLGERQGWRAVETLGLLTPLAPNLWLLAVAVKRRGSLACCTTNGDRPSDTQPLVANLGRSQMPAGQSSFDIERRHAAKNWQTKNNGK
jgi:hypothetical protein